MSEITPDRLADRLADEDDGIFILDIRPGEEYEAWHISGSENIPIYDLLTEDLRVADPALSTLPRDAEIVTVCAAGVVSQKATDRLRTIGYDAKTLANGMQGWSRVHRHAPIEIDIDGTLVQVARPGKGCLSHVLLSDGEAAVYDHSQYVSECESIIDEYDADLVAVGVSTPTHTPITFREDDGSPIATRSRTTVTPTTPTGSTPQR
nr:rhodanese-like domain-containing protein [Halobiforma lacisalsi]